jgi:hypothetical protein
LALPRTEGRRKAFLNKGELARGVGFGLGHSVAGTGAAPGEHAVC